MSTPTWPASWKARIRWSGIACPTWISGEVTSMPNLTRSGRPWASFRSSSPPGRTSTAFRVRSSTTPPTAADFRHQRPSAELGNRPSRHRDAREEDDERAHGGEQPDDAAVEADPAEGPLGDDGDEPDGGDREGKPGAERDDQEQAERHAVERDRSQEDDQGRRAGQQSAGDADADERAPAEVGVVVAVVVVVVMGSRARVREAVAKPAPEHRRADPDDEQARHQVQPRVEPVGYDELRQAERHEAESEDADGVRCRNDQAEQRGVQWRSAASDEVRRDDRLAVPGGQRVRRAPEERCRQRGDDYERTQMTAADQAREAGVRDPVRRLERGPTGERKRSRRPASWSELRGDARHVERALEETLRVRAQFVTDAVRLRADDDLLPADAPSIVVVVIDNRTPAVQY